MTMPAPIDPFEAASGAWPATWAGSKGSAMAATKRLALPSK